MKFTEIKPCAALAPFIHAYWELKGDENDAQWERNFPDGCPGLVINLGETCKTDNGSISMNYGKTYAVGAMTSFNDSFIEKGTHLMGVCLKPAAFSSFYHYAPQNELINSTIEFDKPISFETEKMIENPIAYLNHFYTNRIGNMDMQFQSVLTDIQQSNGQASIYEVAKRNYTTIRQLERKFKTYIGITPKEYSNIIRFQHALAIIQNPGQERSLLEIAFECGFYDHSHLSNEIKRNTGLAPSQL
ncbi:helix-turn-helix domain-containing protein [Pedobacter jeongneungensis]|uniref:helix-turn-helix domain-containing protein n=1 Tax=Pedobacter jeongneungensis TaxID=947309 RepID=UPI00046944E9|nr:helix-turn-helix domain-containing protein [Pedobacter jeongneungensis]